MNISFDNLNNTNFKVKRKKFGISSLILLISFGAIFTAAGLFAYKSVQIDESWSRAQGEIVDVSARVSDGSTTYTPVVRYEVGHKTYQVTSNIGSSLYPNIGDTREVAYNPARPDQSKVVSDTGSKALLLLFPVIGIAMLVLAPLLFVRSLKRSNRIKNLMQTGQKLQGVLVDIQSIGGSNNNTYRIVVSATGSTGTVRNYRSDNLSGIAGLAMVDFRNNPIPIDVYIDPTNPQNYYVDVSDIPNLTPQRIGELIKSVAPNQQSDSFTQEGDLNSPVSSQPIPQIINRKAKEKETTG